MRQGRVGLRRLDDFYGELVECELAVFFYLEGRAEGGLVLLERLEDGRKLVLEQAFHFFVGEFALVEHLRYAVAALRAHERGKVLALFAGTLAEPELVTAAGAGEVPLWEGPLGELKYGLEFFVELQDCAETCTLPVRVSPAFRGVASFRCGSACGLQSYGPS